MALGSSLGGRAALEAALLRFPEHGLRVKRRSRWWRSAAWPDPARPAYVNGVAWVETALGPEAALAALLTLEARYGRRRGEPNAPRTLDLDLIAYGRRVQDGPPALPHPRAARRRFVLGPLAEAAPSWMHPALGRTVEDLLGEAVDGLDAQPIVDGS